MAEEGESSRTIVEGYIVDNGNQKVLVESQDKDVFFPELKGLDIRERIYVDYIGGMTLAQLLADRIFGHTKKVVEGGNEVLVIKQGIRMMIVEPKKKAVVEFISSKKNDIIADQFCFLLSNIFLDPFDPIDSPTRPKLGPEKQEQQTEVILKVIMGEYPESIATP